jgi:hypothetical protein
VWTWVYDPPMTFTILSGRWVGNTGYPAKSSAKGGHPNANTLRRVRENAVRRTAVCLEVDGGHFEHLL